MKTYDEKLTMNEVLDEVQNWIETEFPNDMTPSEYRKAMQTLDDIGMMDFDELMETYPNLKNRFYDEFDFNTSNSEFELKLDEVITGHIAFLEETAEDSMSGEYDW